MIPRSQKPNRAALQAFAAVQSGYFTARQAAESGYSLPLLARYQRRGEVVRIRRGIYRLCYYPNQDHEELVIIWLWAEQQGIFSHTTALELHGLSDLMATKVHLTLPQAWQRRRLRLPPDVVRHHADHAASTRCWFGPIPATPAAATLNDCAQQALAPDMMRQATQQALSRGMIESHEISPVLHYLNPFGGL